MSHQKFFSKRISSEVDLQLIKKAHLIISGDSIPKGIKLTQHNHLVCIFWNFEKYISLVEQAKKMQLTISYVVPIMTKHGHQIDAEEGIMSRIGYMAIITSEADRSLLWFARMGEDNEVLSLPYEVKYFLFTN